LLVEPGLTVVEAGSLQSSRVKLFVQPSRVYQRGAEVRSPVSAEEAAIQPGRHSVVYTNADTYVMFEPLGEPEGIDGDGDVGQGDGG
jgi:hypothetical protein